MEPESDISPTQIGGFRVLRRLASGAMTDVLLARAEGPHGFERVVALKVLLQQFRSDPSFERMFAREASAYARLSHPAIVKLYDFFASEGQLVMVLEYVDGLPLHKLRAMLSIGGERFEDSASLFIGSRIFAALAAAHSARDPETGEFSPVIHRDINPSNILVPWDGHVKISDFGIAKIGNSQGDTRMGFVKGTYGYMAPEQVRGEPVTVRADVYAGALVLWELLARRKAIQRGALPEVEVLKAMAKPEFPSLDTLRPDVNADVREAVRRGLEANPERRAITADEMAAILRKAMKGDEGRAQLADAISRVRPAPASEALAVTRAHPSGPSFPDVTETSAPVSGSAAPKAADSRPSSSRDPDATQPFSVSDLPDDSGAFKRLEFPAVRSATKPAGLAPASGGPPSATAGTPPGPPGSPMSELSDLADELGKSATDLTLVEPLRPGTSEPPSTLPPSSAPSTDSPSTLSFSSPPSPEPWRPSTLGYVRAEPGDQPQTLRFGDSLAPPVAAGRSGGAPPRVSPSAPSSTPASGPGSGPGSGPQTGPPSSSRPLTRPPRPAPSSRSATPPSPSSSNPSTKAPTPISSTASSTTGAAKPAGPTSNAVTQASPVSSNADPHRTLVSPTSPPKEPSPATKTPASSPESASVAASPSPAVVAAPKTASTPPPPVPSVEVAPQPPNALALPTVKVMRSVVPSGPMSSAPPSMNKRSSLFLTLAVVLGSALVGVAAVVLYFRLYEGHAEDSSGAVATATATSSATATAKAGPTTTATARAASTASAQVAPTANVTSGGVQEAGLSLEASAISAKPATTAIAPPPPPATASSAGSDPEAAAAGLGGILTEASQSGHRVFVDGRVAGESPGPLQVRCGAHSVQVGSAGTAKNVDVPCGGSVLVSP